MHRVLKLSLPERFWLISVVRPQNTALFTPQKSGAGRKILETRYSIGLILEQVVDGEYLRFLRFLGPQFVMLGKGAIDERHFDILQQVLF